MHHSFRLHFDTSPGQSVHMVLDDAVVGLQWLGGGWWGGAVDVESGDNYHYRVTAGDTVIAEEPRPRRRVEPWIEGRDVVVERWRWPQPARLSRHSALFSRSLASRYQGNDGEGDPAARVRFRLHEPWIPEGMAPALVGSTPELGSWDPDAAVVMTPSPFPGWRIDLDLSGDNVAYKYVLLDASGTLVSWETGPDRMLPPIGSSSAVVVDDEFRGLDPWRGAGVAVPVFSLRSPRGIGVGEFSDLIPFADWAAAVGLSVIQLLPVNDTVINHDWDDSYPYNPVSVQALHPMYLDVGGIEGHGVAEQIADAGRRFNDLAEIDYVAVMETKWTLLRAAYKNVRLTLDDDSSFADFVDEAWEWLGPYSAWAVFRERYGSAQSDDWGADSSYNPDTVAAMSLHGAPDYEEMRFHWFVQYHLNRQLNNAAAYVRSRGIALKGDLPIGVAPQSVDVWTQPELFHIGAQTGAPPDAFAVLGQNWQFPTYNWPKMAERDYAWWKDRFTALAAYVDVYRIDHVLGFFRIWEIPAGGFDGLVGHFRPALPLSESEVQEALGLVDVAALAEPWIDRIEIKERFGDHAPAVLARFFTGPSAAPGLAADVGTQRAIQAAFADGALHELNAPVRHEVERLLLDVAADVLLLRVDDGYAPRISWEETGHFKRLDPGQQQRFGVMARDFFHHRHSQLWEQQGRRTLPAIVDAADLLTCGEDLGMVPDLVPRIMNELGLLGLEIERMPKRLGEWIADPSRAEYLSVVSPGTHDTTTLRQWWAEDPHFAQQYWREALHESGVPPEKLTPEVAEAILRRQLASPAMLCIFPIADLFAMDGELRSVDADSERINDPSNRHNRWRYRIHLDTSDLAAATAFNDRVRAMLREAGRR